MFNNWKVKTKKCVALFVKICLDEQISCVVCGKYRENLKT